MVLVPALLVQYRPSLACLFPTTGPHQRRPARRTSLRAAAHAETDPLLPALPPCRSRHARPAGLDGVRRRSARAARCHGSDLHGDVSCRGGAARRQYRFRQRRTHRHPGAGQPAVDESAEPGAESAAGLRDRAHADPPGVRGDGPARRRAGRARTARSEVPDRRRRHREPQTLFHQHPEPVAALLFLPRRTRRPAGHRSVELGHLFHPEPPVHRRHIGGARPRGPSRRRHRRLHHGVLADRSGGVQPCRDGL